MDAKIVVGRERLVRVERQITSQFERVEAALIELDWMIKSRAEQGALEAGSLTLGLELAHLRELQQVFAFGLEVWRRTQIHADVA